MTPRSVSDPADFHAATLVVDGLQAAPMNAEHFERLRVGGVDAVNYTTATITHDFSNAALDILRLRNTVARHPGRVLLVEDTTDILEAHRTGRTGLIIGLQSARPVMEDVGYVEALHHFGVRIIQLTYNERNVIGDGCVERANGGLSRFGRRVVAEMNRLGMLVDVSHCGERTTLDAIEASTLPIAATHSNAKSLTPSPRNKSPEVIRALAERGGVIGAAFWAPMAYRDPGARPRFSDFLDHVERLVEHAGVDHVGIGSDLGEGESREYYEAMFARGGGIYPEVTELLGEWYDFDGRMVEGLESTVAFPLVTAGLFERGFGSGDVAKIMGGNFLRVMQQAWAPGARS